MSFIFNIADYIYNSICNLTNNLYFYFYPNNTINPNKNEIIIPFAVSESEIYLSDNSDSETDNIK